MVNFLQQMLGGGQQRQDFQDFVQPLRSGTAVGRDLGPGSGEPL